MPIAVSAYQSLLEQCRLHEATLVAVSKTRPDADVLALYGLGQRLFAENRVQELLHKAPSFPRDIEWHLIGHLQTNKVRDALKFARCIQSLDSEKLWQKIDTEARAANLNMDCLLQVKVATEDTKYGWDADELKALLTSGRHLRWKNVNIRGVMGMASLTEDPAQVRGEMKKLKHHFDALHATHFPEENFNILSMGMSGDYQIALEEGSSMIRVGSLLFT